MKNKTIALTGALLIGGLLTFNSVAFADTTDVTTSANVPKPIQFVKKIRGKMGDFAQKGAKDVVFMHKQDWSADLKALVADGTIAQTTADKIQAYITEQENTMKAEMEKLQAMTPEQRRAYFESNKQEIKKDEAAKGNIVVRKHDLFSDLVEKGIITQQEADAIKSKLQTLRQTERQEEVKADLNKLVEAKTITQEQAAKVIEYMNKQKADKAAEMEKMQDMTLKEITAYFKDKDINKVSIFSQLVADNVLTQEQADAVQKELHPMGFHRGDGPMMLKKVFKGNF